MSKKSRFRSPCDKQYGKRTQTLLKSAPQHSYHLYWSLPRQLSERKSLLFTCQILGLLVNTLTADDRYPFLNRENLTIPVQMQLFQKQKTFSEFLAVFLKYRLNLEHFETNMALIDFVLPKLRTLKTWLDKCLKSSVLEAPSTSGMVNWTKHCRNLNQNTLIIFIDHCQGNWVTESLSFWHAKSWDWFLTHSLPIISIPFLIKKT